jgi:hypothetical protein
MPGCDCCGRNGYGAVFCGSELDEYRARISRAKEEATQAGEAASNRIREAARQADEAAKG